MHACKKRIFFVLLNHLKLWANSPLFPHHIHEILSSDVAAFAISPPHNHRHNNTLKSNFGGTESTSGYMRLHFWQYFPFFLFFAEFVCLARVGEMEQTWSRITCGLSFPRASLDPPWHIAVLFFSVIWVRKYSSGWWPLDASVGSFFYYNYFKISNEMRHLRPKYKDDHHRNPNINDRDNLVGRHVPNQLQDIAEFCSSAPNQPTSHVTSSPMLVSRISLTLTEWIRMQNFLFNFF